MTEKFNCLVALVADRYPLDRLLNDDSEYKKEHNILDCYKQFWFRYYLPLIKEYGVDTVNEVVDAVYTAVKAKEAEEDGENQ